MVFSTYANLYVHVLANLNSLSSVHHQAYTYNYAVSPKHTKRDNNMILIVETCTGVHKPRFSLKRLVVTTHNKARIVYRTQSLVKFSTVGN